MKAHLFKLLIFLSGLVVSCNDLKPTVEDVNQSVAIGEDGCVTPVNAPEEVQAFFNERISGEYGYGYDIGFSLGDRTKCVVIDNMDEFRDIAPVGIDLPKIDFDKHTLIIGCVILGGYIYDFISQKIYSESDRIILSLEFNYIDGISLDEDVFYAFWGLYPKLPDREIELDVKYINVDKLASN